MSKSTISNKSQTNWERLDTMSDEDIDLSDIPELTPEMFAKAVVKRGLKDKENPPNMKINKLTQRLQKDRPLKRVSIRIPDDVIDDLKRVAPLLGFSGYQALIKAYIGQGLRSDLEHLEGNLELSALIESLRKRGVDDELISSAMADVQNSTRAA